MVGVQERAAMAKQGLVATQACLAEAEVVVGEHQEAERHALEQATAAE